MTTYSALLLVVYRQGSFIHENDFRQLAYFGFLNRSFYQSLHSLRLDTMRLSKHMEGLARLCKYSLDVEAPTPRIGVSFDGVHIHDLPATHVASLSDILESESPTEFVRKGLTHSREQHAVRDVKLLAPIDHQEVWAAGVTYLRSKSARMEESDFSATAYDRVYDAPRPEIFFKSLGEKVVGPNDAVGIRQDAHWNVPEPELALVMNANAQLVGCTIGNDMSSRDIEGENLLYLPQAKTYSRSCSLGPWIVLMRDEVAIREWSISISIVRNGHACFSGKTSINQIKRSFSELISYLWQSQTFPHGVVLLTGTGVVPDESFTLIAGDQIVIEISGIGQISNHVVVV